MSIKKPAGLSGSSGLVAAIIAQATTDALRESRRPGRTH